MCRCECHKREALEAELRPRLKAAGLPADKSHMDAAEVGYWLAKGEGTWR